MLWRTRTLTLTEMASAIALEMRAHWIPTKSGFQGYAAADNQKQTQMPMGSKIA
jgi:hypothetical protein